jgi:hypothetical protein
LAGEPAADAAPIPADSLVFGYGPMLPPLAAAIGAWVLPVPWPGIATALAILWSALILAFVAGVRRGFGFGAPGASKHVEIVTMAVYFVPAGVALIFGWVDRPAPALALLALAYLLVAVLDRRAALNGDAPAHFARLRPPQMSIGVIALAALFVHALA